MLPGQLPLPTRWEQIFNRQAPLVLEIGCGNGRYLIQQAETSPEKNFVGIEPAPDYFYLMKERIVKRRLTNIRILRSDAVSLVTSCFPDDCVDVYHIYFPDPWPKRNHRPRRIFTPEFCKELNRTLKPDGILFFATDHQDYFKWMQPAIRATMQVKDHPEPWEDAPEGRTNFEMKYIKQGRPIWRLTAKSVPIR